MYTVDVLLCEPSDYRGGVFSTLEADGASRTHAFEKRGDALCFQSHKFHSVSPVTAGERRVLIVEFWLGEARTCAHRCPRHWGPCNYSAGDSFLRRVFVSNVAGDLF